MSIKFVLSAGILSIGLVMSLLAVTNAQHAGSRSGNYDVAELSITPLDVETVSSHITFSGTSEKRIKPTDIRLVWAVTSEANDSPSCLIQIENNIKRVIESWNAVGVTNKDIVEDFISIIPVFEWQPSTINGNKVVIEKLVRYRMQSNLHVQVKSNKKAMQVIKAALGAGLTDLIGVDYSADLKSAQQGVRLEATNAAKRKATTLLSALFDETPLPINIQEVTQTHYPSKMYDSFVNSSSQSINNWYGDNNLPRIGAHRPSNTYYRGRQNLADNKSYALPMNPEIIVESKVVIYYQSPAAKNRSNQIDPKKE